MDINKHLSGNIARRYLQNTYQPRKKTYRVHIDQGTLDEMRVMHDGLSVVGREEGDVCVSLQYVYQVPHIAYTNVPLTDKNAHGIMHYENITHIGLLAA